MSFISRIRTIVITSVAAAGAVACVQMQMPGPEGIKDSAMAKIVNNSEDAVEGQLLVCLSDGPSSLLQASGNQEELDIRSIKPVFNVTEQNRKHLAKYGLDKWYILEYEGAGLDHAAKTVAEFAAVSRVQYNKQMAVVEAAESTSDSNGDDLSGEGLPFNDTYLKYQWHYINNGSRTIASEAAEGADIGVKDVWSQLDLAGDSEIVVAVIDGPIKHTHEDLKDNMWENIFEIPENDIDDDKNGYIDDIHGWNFERDTCELGWKKDGETGHGTHVAGIVAAVNNNGIGVSGVAGGTGKGDGVKLMSCQTMEGGISTNTYSAVNSFVYAADNGAHIAQCSFGYQNGNYKSDYEYYYYYGIEYFAIQYFLDKDRFAENEDRLNEKLVAVGKPKRTKIIDGPLVIFASGNDGLDYSSYPGALMDCICVTATGPDGFPAYYTNFGPGCNIAAPGGDGLLNPSTSRSEVYSTCVSEAGRGDYAYMSGTSMACPHVSGVAALGLAYVKRLLNEGKKFNDKDYITREDFTALLLSSVNDIDSKLSSGYKYLGVDASTGAENAPRPYTSYQHKMGTGTLDAWKFMMNLEGTPTLTVKAGVKGSYDLSNYFGDGSEHLTFYPYAEIEEETLVSLGLIGIPVIKDGKLVIDPGKVGSGKIKITAIAGGDRVSQYVTGDWTGNGDYVTIPNNGGGMGGTYITREISVVSRGVASKNGGWL